MNCLLNLFGLPCLLDKLSKIFTLTDLQNKATILSQPFCVPFSVLIPKSNLLYFAESLPLWSSPLFLGDENVSLSANDEEEASKV